MATPQVVPVQKTTKGPCQACGKEMDYIFPTPRIFNEIDVSILAIAHPPSRCAACGGIHLPLIAGISEEGVFELTWKLMKVQRSPMIVGGSDNALKQAIKQAQFTEELKRKGN